MRTFQEAVAHRRTIYGLNKDISLLPEEIIAAVERLVKEVPSAFNMQSGRVVVALGEHHDKIWDITMEALRKKVPAEKFTPTEAKINGFKAAYGTVLYFEETDTVKALQAQFPSYAPNFPVWASQANGMLQFAIWTELENMGLGVNLQHYNPLIDEDVKAYFRIPESWTLVAQMPFGNPTENPAPKEKLPTEERVKIWR